MPESFKQSIVCPILKKPSLDCENLSNYRPVSQLRFISKVVERLVAARLVRHLNNNKILNPQQSGFRRGHSCETAITAVLNDAILAIDQKEITVLILLDLSSAFDTVDHTLLLNRLESAGVRSNALEWFRTYIHNRSQSVNIESHASSSTNTKWGVPQGSVLGPILFILYINGVGEIIERWGVKHIIYADDIQLYLSSSPSTLTSTIAIMENCIDAIKEWLHKSYLSLNESKSDAIIFGSKSLLTKCAVQTIRVGSINVSFKEKVRNLGIMLDSHLTLKYHTSKITRSAYLSLRVISRQRRCLNYTARKMAVQALVHSQINFGLGLLNGITTSQVQCLQRVINATARFTSGIRPRESITPFLRENNWLPVKYQIQFKNLCLVFQAASGTSPSYISDMCKVYNSPCNLRSNDGYTLVVPRTNSYLGDRAFSVFGPKIWNELPLNIRNVNKYSTFYIKSWNYLYDVWSNSL
jgi:hypothetical protein